MLCCMLSCLWVLNWAGSCSICVALCRACSVSYHVPMQVESRDAARLVEQLKCIKVTYVRGIRMPKPDWCSQADEPCVLQAHLAIVRQLPDRTDLQTWTGDSIPGLFGW